MPPHDRSLIVRLLVLAALMGVGAVASAHVRRTEAVRLREPLEAFPLAFDGWRGREQPALAPNVVEALGADAYLEREYRNDGASVGLFIGYYASQRQGDSVHSPLNCLPGSGWSAVEADYLDVPRGPDQAAAQVNVRRLRVRRGSDDALVLYWYQSRGRVVANEYWNKAYLMYDAVRLNRTDAALIRVFSMIDERTGGVRRAEADLVTFVRAMFPLLDRHLPK
ncbi:MAG TPA: EpsI family protein [Vicinamibacterales bacterium]|nr:EpsI family protein [Vicinamibacterales bacterium]